MLKPIPGFSSYFISECGHVWSCKNRRPRILKVSDKHGYPCISIVSDDGAERTIQIASLLLTAFVGPCPEGMECCHNNGVRHDLSLSNLRWDTHKNNFQDMVRHGRCKLIRGGCQRIFGENNGSAKLTDVEVADIRSLSGSGATRKEIASSFGISTTHVGNILNHKCRSTIGHSAKAHGGLIKLPSTEAASR